MMSVCPRCLRSEKIDETGPAPGWVSLEKGLRFIRAGAVVHVEWNSESHDKGWDANPRWSKTWWLVVHTVDDRFKLYGDDASRLLQALGLPTTIPEGV